MSRRIDPVSGPPPQPLQLRAVLAAHGIQISELAAATSCPGTGRQVARSTLSQYLTRGEWPARLAADLPAVQRQIERHLLAAGLTVAPDCWAKENGPDAEDIGAADSQNNLVAILAEPIVLSQRARQHFLLTKDPFSDDVNCAEDVFVAGDQRYVREVMWQAARHGGFVAVIGESGAGKSVLRRELIDRVERETAKLVLITPQVIDKGRMTAAMICDAIIADLGGQLGLRPRRASAHGYSLPVCAPATTMCCSSKKHTTCKSRR